LLKERRRELRSKFTDHFKDVKVNILEEDPGNDFNPFTSRSVAGERSTENFVNPGLDLTV